MSHWGKYPHASEGNGDAYELPVDLAAVQADDALLDMIAAGHAPSDAEDELTRMLAAWRDEVHAEPVRELVDTSTALALIRAAARQPARQRRPWFGTAAAAAAVLVISFSAVGLVAKSAQPGDHLWGATQMLYPEYAQSVETAAAVRTELNEANSALQQGDPARARAALEQAQKRLPAVREDQGRTELTTKHRQLEQKLNAPPESASVQVPGRPIIEWPTRPGAEPKVNEPPEPRFPDEPTPPSPPRGLPNGPSTSKSDPGFFPGPHYPRYPYPHPSPPDNGSGGADDSPGTDIRTNDTTGDTHNSTPRHGPAHRPRVDDPPPPSPSPDDQSTESKRPGMSPNPGPLSDPRYSGRSFPGCDRPPPRPSYCG